MYIRLRREKSTWIRLIRSLLYSKLIHVQNSPGGFVQENLYPSIHKFPEEMRLRIVRTLPRNSVFQVSFSIPLTLFSKGFLWQGRSRTLIDGIRNTRSYNIASPSLFLEPRPLKRTDIGRIQRRQWSGSVSNVSPIWGLMSRFKTYQPCFVVIFRLV